MLSILTVMLAGMLAQAPAPGVSATISPRIESLRYRFENPSSFNTEQLVPHFFEQTYDTDNVWIGGRARYRVMNIAAETNAAFTPRVTGQADDLDTFFQPDGNVIVYGTLGAASLRAWQASQRFVVGHTGTFQYGVGYSYRRDSATYHEGTRITRMTRPPSELRELVATREFVTSQIHEAQWFARWSPAGHPLSLLVEASPFAIGRLGIELPDKYPGRTLVFSSRSTLVGVEAAARWAIGSMDLELAARADRSFSYSDRATMTLRGISIVVRAGTR